MGFLDNLSQRFFSPNVNSDRSININNAGATKKSGDATLGLFNMSTIFDTKLNTKINANTTNNSTINEFADNRQISILSGSGTLNATKKDELVQSASPLQSGATIPLSANADIGGSLFPLLVVGGVGFGAYKLLTKKRGRK